MVSLRAFYYFLETAEGQPAIAGDPEAVGNPESPRFFFVR